MGLTRKLERRTKESQLFAIAYSDDQSAQTALDEIEDYFLGTENTERTLQDRLKGGLNKAHEILQYQRELSDNETGYCCSLIVAAIKHKKCCIVWAGNCSYNYNPATEGAPQIARVRSTKTAIRHTSDEPNLGQLQRLESNPLIGSPNFSHTENNASLKTSYGRDIVLHIDKFSRNQHIPKTSDRAVGFDTSNALRAFPPGISHLFTITPPSVKQTTNTSSVKSISSAVQHKYNNEQYLYFFSLLFFGLSLCAILFAYILYLLSLLPTLR